MSETIEISLAVIGIFALSFAAGYAITRMRRRAKAPIPKVNAVMRIMTAGTVYRAHFVGEKEDGWAFTPPLQRDNYIPIKVGEPVVIETVMDGGIVVFKTYLKARHNAPPLMIAAKPANWHVEDRRESIRIGEVGHLQTKLDGDRVGLLDISTCGARIRSQARKAAGERVKLEVAGQDEALYGWVIEEARKGDRYIIRVRFEEPADLAQLVG